MTIRTHIILLGKPELLGKKTAIGYAWFELANELCKAYGCRKKCENPTIERNIDPYGKYNARKSI